MAPIQNNICDFEARPGKEKEAVREQEDDLEGEQQKWPEIRHTVEDLIERVVGHFEDANEETDWTAPMVKTPPQPTREKRLRHQLTHTHVMRRGASIAFRRGL